MRYRNLGKTGLKVSELSLGGGMLKAGDEKSLQLTRGIVHRALELGINYFDTAPAYGDSEKALGIAIYGVTQPCIISTKFGGRPQPFNPKDKNKLRKSFEESLKLLRRDTVDILFIHEPDRPGQYDWFLDWEDFHGPVHELMDELKSEGIIKFTGLAGTTAYEMARIMANADFDVVLTAFNYSLLWQEALFSIIPAAKERKMGIIIGSPLQHGALSQLYKEEVDHGAPWLSPPRRAQFKKLYELVEEVGIPIAELGVRFVLSNPDISCVLTGVKSIAELEQNVHTAVTGALPKEILQKINEIATMVPFRPYEEPYKLPFHSAYRGPGHIGHLYGI